MVTLKLTNEQIQYLQKNQLNMFPDGSVKIIHEKYRDVLIIDLNKLYSLYVCSKIEYLQMIEQYESIGWIYYAAVSQYVYFIKKHDLMFKIKKFFGIKLTN